MVALFSLVNRLNKFFGLQFEDEKLESAYQKNYAEEHLQQNIASAKIAILLYLFYAPVTYFLIDSEPMLLTFIVAFSISAPLFLISIVKSRLFQRYATFILFSASVIAGLGPSLFYVFTENERAIFQVDLLIPVIAIFTMYSIGFTLSLLSVLSIFTIFLLLCYTFNVPALDIAMAVYTLLFGGLISATAAYLIEKTKRKFFLVKIKSDEFKLIIEKSSDFISIFDKETYVYLYSNESVLKVNGFSLEEIIGKKVTEIHPEVSEEKIDYMISEIEKNGKYSDVLALQSKDARTYYVHTVLEFGHYNFKDVIIATASEVTELKEAELKIKKMAERDFLTKLYNRHMFNEYSMQYINMFMRYKTPVSLIICDIDHFKVINDTYGHLVGDEVLIKIANIIESSTRESDIVARWGGEEFAILLPKTSLDEAIVVAEKIRKNVAVIPHDKVGHVYISCGVAQLEEGETQATWFKKVDDLLYKAKESGRNRVCHE